MSTYCTNPRTCIPSHKPDLIDPFSVSKHCDVFLWAELRWRQKESPDRLTNAKLWSLLACFTMTGENPILPAYVRSLTFRDRNCYLKRLNFNGRNQIGRPVHALKHGWSDRIPSTSIEKLNVYFKEKPHIYIREHNGQTHCVYLVMKMYIYFRFSRKLLYFYSYMRVNWATIQKKVKHSMWRIYYLKMYVSCNRQIVI